MDDERPSLHVYDSLSCPFRLSDRTFCNFTAGLKALIPCSREISADGFSGSKIVNSSVGSLPSDLLLLLLQLLILLPLDWLGFKMKIAHPAVFLLNCFLPLFFLLSLSLFPVFLARPTIAEQSALHERLTRLHMLVS